MSGYSSPGWLGYDLDSFEGMLHRQDLDGRAFAEQRRQERMDQHDPTHWSLVSDRGVERVPEDVIRRDQEESAQS